MAPRPNWRGFLKLSLVSCPVALYPATSTSQRVRFHIINRETGNRIRNQVVDSETGKEVRAEDRVKGYEFAKGQYLLVEDEELDNVALPSTHTIDIEAFVPAKEVDRLYLDESHYIVPQDEVGQDAFAVIREAMRKENLSGLARVVIHRRERLLLLAPRERGIIATTLRAKTEVRDAKNYFDEIKDIKIPADMLQLAVHILETKKGHFDPNKFEDRYEKTLNDLIAAKRAGKKPPVATEEQPSNVINLMDALRRSAGTNTKSRPTEERSRSTRARRPARKQPARKRTRKAG
jgi:DNA end-binding protein Ku